MRLFRVTLTLFVGAALTMAGCRQEEDIVKETVDHPDREPIRLRVAVVEKGEVVWFFRMSGPIEQVKEHGKTLDDFVASVTFDKDDEPTWTEPKGWKKDPKGRDRYASFRVDAKPKGMEIAVTRFLKENFDLMKNMHRWQKQVNVPLTEKHDDLPKAQKVGAQMVTWVDLTGLGVHTVSKAPEPMAENKKKFLPGPLLNKKPAAAQVGGGGDRIPFKYDVPAGWAKKPPGQFAVDAYEIANNITITLTPAGGNLNENINRWRQQVQLPPATPAELKKAIVEMPIAGSNGFYVDLANPNGPAGKNRTLGVIVPTADATWFVKMMGPHDAVGKHKDEFESFVKSFKLAK